MNNFLYKKLFLSSVFVYTFASAMQMNHPEINQAFDKEGKPTPVLAKLLHAFDIEAETSEDIVKATQSKWLRTAGKERWEAEDPYASRKEELLPLFEQIGVISEIKPQQKQYDYVLIMGGLYRRVEARMKFATTLWNNGIRFKEIILLGSERELNSQEEPASHFFDFNYQESLDEIPKTEYEMMKYVYTNTPLPVEMAQTKTSFINTPNTIINGQTKRATTQDTINQWLKSDPKPGTCLVISNQPHIDYQKSVAKVFLPQTFTVDAAGAAWDKAGKVNEILDAIARWIYQENLLREKK